MALNHAIRRAASSVVPLAIKASAGTQRCLRHHTSALFAAVNRPSLNLAERSVPIFLRSYSDMPGADPSLLQVIDTEIQCAADSQNEGEAEEIPQDFPFEIEDHPGQPTITLRRDYQGETIIVEVQMPFDGENNQEDEDEENVDQTTLPLVVRVSKKGKRSLEFGCTAYAEEIVIDSLAIKDPEISDDQIAYEGPDFGDLGENLQKAFIKYLEVRGIKPSTTCFLHGYMLDKDFKEYTTWLKNVQEFVQE